VLRLLQELGYDLKKPCDPMGYGAPAFWAANYGREHVLLELFNLGIDLDGPCERYGKSAVFMCGVRGNHGAIDRVNALRAHRASVATMVQAHVRGYFQRKTAKEFARRAHAAARAQKLMRGEVVRIQRGFGRHKKRPVKERVERRQKGAVKIEALVRGGVVRMKGM
jgi:hypothetical protein